MKGKFERVSVVGLGYVGLPMAALLASRGIEVVGVDVNERAVNLINQGRIHITEPDLDIMVQAAATTGRLRATTRAEPADAFVIAVPTPFTEGHRPDVSYLEAAARSVAPVLKEGDLVVLESTSPVGTTEALAGWLAGHRPDLRFPLPGTADPQVNVAHSPERVLPGRVLLELVQNDRVVGGLTPACAERAANLYRLFLNGQCLLTDARTAELVKLTENSYRDVNIAFANELSLVCDKLGIDVWQVIELANRHPRVNILKPGPGVGGHCIAVDPWFIVDSAPDQSPLIRTAREVNDGKPHHVVATVRAAAAERNAGRVACLGLSYKADIDDMRESPAIEIAAHLAGDLAVLVVEPYAETLPPPLDRLPNARLATLDEALDACEVIALLVDHAAFRRLDRARLAGKAVIDTRGIWR